MKKTNFDGMKKTAVNNFVDEINFKQRVLAKRKKRIKTKMYLKYFITGFFIGVGILIIMNEMLGNPIYQYFLNK